MSSRLIFYLTTYDERSGGMRAIYYLVDLLKRYGYDAAVNRLAERNDVAICPDACPGNPGGARRVVRFMCFFASACGKGYNNGARIKKDECVILYHPNYFDDVATHYDGKLSPENVVTVPSIEPGLFYPQEKIRDAVLYIGKETVRCPFRPMPIVTKHNIPRADFALALRQTSNLYSQDHHTVVTAEAALAGCQPWYVFAADRVVKAEVADPQAWVMDAVRDEPLAHKFVGIVRKFFNDEAIGRA